MPTTPPLPLLFATSSSTSNLKHLPLHYHPPLISFSPHPPIHHSPSLHHLHRRTYTPQPFLPSTPAHDRSTSISLVPLARRRHAFTFSIYPPPSARKSHPLPHFIHHCYIAYGEWFIESPPLSSAKVPIHCTKTDKYAKRNVRKAFREVSSNPIIYLDHG